MILGIHHLWKSPKLIFLPAMEAVGLKPLGFGSPSAVEGLKAADPSGVTGPLFIDDGLIKSSIYTIYIYIYIYIYTYIYIYIYIYIHIHIYIYVYICMYIYVYIHNIPIKTSMFTGWFPPRITLKGQASGLLTTLLLHTCWTNTFYPSHIYIYIYMCMCIYIYIHTYTYIYICIHMGES